MLENDKPIKEAPVLICYICGGKYGTMSLKYHLMTCEKEFKRKEKELAKYLKKKLPELPEELKDFMKNTKSSKLRKIYNDKAQVMSIKINYWMCPYCNRTFLDDKIGKHQRGCTKETPLTKPIYYKGNLDSYRVISKSIIEEQEKLALQKQREKEETQFLNCYLCSLDYGTKSLKIHLRYCKQRWLQQRKMMYDDENVKLPEPPRELSELEDMDKMDPMIMDIYNKKALQIYEKWSNGKCNDCERTFTLSALEKHQVSCKGEKYIPCQQHGQWADKIKPTQPTPKVPEGGVSKGVTAGGVGGQKRKVKTGRSSKSHFEKRPLTVYCYLCYGQFSFHSIKIHLMSCKWNFLNRQVNKEESIRHGLPNTPRQLTYLYKNGPDLNKEQLDDEVFTFNELALDLYERLNCDPCQYCQKSINESRREAHLRACSKKPQLEVQKAKKGRKKKAQMSYLDKQKWVKRQMKIYEKRKEKRLKNIYDYETPESLKLQLCVQCGYCKKSFSNEQIHNHRKVCQEYQMVLINNKKGIQIRKKIKSSGIGNDLEETLFTNYQKDQMKYAIKGGEKVQKLMLQTKGEPIIKEKSVNGLLPKYPESQKKKNESTNGISLKHKITYVKHPKLNNQENRVPLTTAQKLRFTCQFKENITHQALQNQLQSQRIQMDETLSQLMLTGSQQLLNTWKPAGKDSLIYNRLENDRNFKRYGNDQFFEKPICSECEFQNH